MKKREIHVFDVEVSHVITQLHTVIFGQKKCCSNEKSQTNYQKVFDRFGDVSLKGINVDIPGIKDIKGVPQGSLVLFTINPIGWPNRSRIEVLTSDFSGNLRNFSSEASVMRIFIPGLFSLLHVVYTGIAPFFRVVVGGGDEEDFFNGLLIESLHASFHNDSKEVTVV